MAIRPLRGITKELNVKVPHTLNSVGLVTLKLHNTVLKCQQYYLIPLLESGEGKRRGVDGEG